MLQRLLRLLRLAFKREAEWGSAYGRSALLLPASIVAHPTGKYLASVATLSNSPSDPSASKAAASL
eukprot:3328883-Pleurochrysis_carterae.AAC.1